MMRTVHWFQKILLIFMHLDWLELAISVIGIVARNLIEINFSDMWGVDRLITTGGEFLTNESLKHTSQPSAFGHPKDKPGTNQGANRKEVQLLSKHTVISLPRFL